MRKLNSETVKWFAAVHTTSRWQRWDLPQGLDSEACALNGHMHFSSLNFTAGGERGHCLKPLAKYLTWPWLPRHPALWQCLFVKQTYSNLEEVVGETQDLQDSILTRASKRLKLTSVARLLSSPPRPSSTSRVAAAWPVHVLLTLSVGMTPGCAEALVPVIRNVNDSGFLPSALALCLPPIPTILGCASGNRCPYPKLRPVGLWMLFSLESNTDLLTTYPEPETF